ncbi:glucosamine-6-phosphate deaminase [Roseicyclus sp. F158]|uniref:Glucosamine-6-phosphate deaminase n=1 Tax=Tropicimonas omnivorans TaxID=3075590 RepID=A0ABU3DCI6_9RHOB|nr:glucosamine-6-phosphate deaminase [Roseicyclus sp. F158]MDT0681268.1 glucosamine-6-phosphate deaminase [Roseicyclus sp. F158]
MTHAPELTILDDGDAVTSEAARMIAAVIADTPGAVLGLATGRTPLAVYARLREDAAAGKLSFEGVRSFNLDEYLGLPPEHPASYHSYMRREFFDHVDLRAGDWHLPDGMADDPAAAGGRYEVAIRQAGGIDLQLLGIGENGHIGFNEPGAPFDSRTRKVALAASTIAANASEFPDGQTPPSHALTMGIATILEARRIVLLATGSKKAKALDAMLSGTIDPAVPASALRLHPAVTILCDKEAASCLQDGNAAVR